MDTSKLTKLQRECIANHFERAATKILKNEEGFCCFAVGESLPLHRLCMEIFTGLFKPSWRHPNQAWWVLVDWRDPDPLYRTFDYNTDEARVLALLFAAHVVRHKLV